jgi:L-rhamnonate dehydratase
LFLREGPDAGLPGLNRTEQLVAQTREQVGPDVEIAVDCWMSMNTDYMVRLAEMLRPYRIKWLEDYILPEDMDSYFNLRQRIPYQCSPQANTGTRSTRSRLLPVTVWSTSSSQTCSGLVE